MDLRALLFGRLTFACLVVASSGSHAEITVFTSQASFLSAVSAPGVDTFAGFPTTIVTPSPIERAAGPYAYSASSATGFFGAGTVADPALSTNSDSDVIMFFELSGGASAVGGVFFGTDIDGNFVDASMVLTATDSLGASVTHTMLAGPSTFIGFVSTGTIASLVLATSMPGEFVFPTVDDLTIAMASGVTPIPEAETWSLLLAGMATLSLYARRRRARSG
jgi:hypothetical protein